MTCASKPLWSTKKMKQAVFGSIPKTACWGSALVNGLPVVDLTKRQDASLRFLTANPRAAILLARSRARGNGANNSRFFIGFALRIVFAVFHIDCRYFFYFLIFFALILAAAIAWLLCLATSPYITKNGSIRCGGNGGNAENGIAVTVVANWRHHSAITIPLHACWRYGSAIAVALCFCWRYGSTIAVALRFCGDTIPP